MEWTELRGGPVAGAANTQGAERGSSISGEEAARRAISGAKTSAELLVAAAGGESGAWTVHPQPELVSVAPTGAGCALESFSPGPQQQGAFCFMLAQCFVSLPARIAWLGAGRSAHAKACAGLSTPVTTRARPTIQISQDFLCRKVIMEFRPYGRLVYYCQYIPPWGNRQLLFVEVVARFGFRRALYYWFVEAVRKPRSRKLLVTTETLESAMAALAKMGERVMPKNGYSSPAATGIPSVL